MRSISTQAIFHFTLAAIVFILTGPALQAQEADDGFFGSGPIIQGGDIGVPLPTKNGKDAFGNKAPGPGCYIDFSSGPGIVGPPCAMVCVGVSAEDAPPYQATCDGLSPNALHTVVFGDISNPDPSEPVTDGTPHCVFLKGSAEPFSNGGWFPNGHPRCMGVRGDPHLTTFDGVRYDLQSAGEFIVAKSVDDEFEVQARFEPWGSSRRASLTTAIAVRVGTYRISITSHFDQPLRVNGEPYDVPDGEYLILSDADTMILRDGQRHSIVLPDRTNVHVDLFDDTSINFFILLPEDRDGRVVGLGGGGDGDDANDFVLRDGTQLSERPSVDVLYDAFAESWRVTEAESLFDYDPGESWSGYQKPDMPYVYVGMEDLPSADRERAESTCRAAGLTDGPALDDCIFDYALTGDEMFIESALSTQAPPNFASQVAVVTLDGPNTAIAGEDISIAFTGGRIDSSDWVSVAVPEAPANRYSDYAYVRTGSPATLRMPLSAGEYEIRYVQDGTEIRARRSITVTEAVASLDAPVTAGAGESIEIAFTGPEAGSGDWITVTAADDPPGTYNDYHYIRRGSPAQIRMPLDAGDYEIRYVQGGQQVLARSPIRIETVPAGLTGPETAIAGETVSFDFYGPEPGSGDWVTVTAPDEPPGTYTDYHYSREGSPAAVRMPLDAGTYEVRFIQGGKKIIARHEIRVQPASATITAPDTAEAGSTLDVGFTGPAAGSGDYITVSEIGSEDRDYVHYANVSRGSPARLRMPTEPGNYEIRFVQGNTKALARHPIEIVPQTDNTPE